MTNKLGQIIIVNYNFTKRHSASRKDVFMAQNFSFGDKSVFVFWKNQHNHHQLLLPVTSSKRATTLKLQGNQTNFTLKLTQHTTTSISMLLLNTLLPYYGVNTTKKSLIFSRHLCLVLVWIQLRKMRAVYCHLLTHCAERQQQLAADVLFEMMRVAGHSTTAEGFQMYHFQLPFVLKNRNASGFWFSLVTEVGGKRAIWTFNRKIPHFFLLCGGMA